MAEKDCRLASMLAFFAGLLVMYILIIVFTTTSPTDNEYRYIETRALCLNANCSVLQDFELRCHGSQLISIEPLGSVMQNRNGRQPNMDLCNR